MGNTSRQGVIGLTLEQEALKNCIVVVLVVLVYKCLFCFSFSSLFKVGAHIFKEIKRGLFTRCSGVTGIVPFLERRT